MRPCVILRDCSILPVLVQTEPHTQPGKEPIPQVDLAWIVREPFLLHIDAAYEHG